MDPQRTAKRTIADSHNEAGTPESENLGLLYRITYHDLRAPADTPPTLSIEHLWGDDQVLLGFAIVLPDGTNAVATRQLDAMQLADYLEEAARNLKQRDLGTYLADA